MLKSLKNFYCFYFTLHRILSFTKLSQPNTIIFKIKSKKTLEKIYKMLTSISYIFYKVFFDLTLNIMVFG